MNMEPTNTLQTSGPFNATSKLVNQSGTADGHVCSTDAATAVQMCCRILDETQKRTDQEVSRNVIRLQHRKRGCGRRLGSHCQDVVLTTPQLINQLQFAMERAFDVFLNQKAPYNATAARAIALTQEILTYSVMIEEGNVIISTICRNFQATEQSKDGIALLSWLQFIPNDARLHVRVVAMMQQILQVQMPNRLPPAIFIYRVLPHDSRIFNAIRDGDISTVWSLIKTGTTGLRDCTPEGHSLLGVSVYHSQPAICQFLIESGAELESLEPNNTYSKDIAPFASPLSIIMDKNFGDTWQPEDREIMAQLLFAGADLCNAMLRGPDPVFWIFRQPDCSLWKTLPTIQSALAELPLDQRHRHGRTILHQCAIDTVQEYQMLRYESDEALASSAGRALELLIDSGYNVNAQDDDGDTCLHMLSAGILHKLGRVILEKFVGARGSFCGVKNGMGATVAEALRRGVEDGVGGSWEDLLWVGWNVEELLLEYGRGDEARRWAEFLIG